MNSMRVIFQIGLLTLGMFFVLDSPRMLGQTVEESTIFIDRNRDFAALRSSREEMHDRSHLIETSSINNPLERRIPRAIPPGTTGQHYPMTSQFSAGRTPLTPSGDSMLLGKNVETSQTITTQAPIELLSNDEVLVKWDSSTVHDIYPPYGGADQVIWEAIAETFDATVEYTDEAFSETYFDGATAAVIPMFNRGTLISQEEAVAVKNFVDAGGRVLLCGYYDKMYWNYFSENGTNLIAEQFGVTFAVPEGTPEENRWAEVLDPVNNYGQPYELRITNFEPHPLTVGVTEWYLKAPSLVVTNPDVTILARGSPDASYYTDATGWLYGADNIFLAMLENDNGGGIVFSAGAYILRNDYTAQHGWDHGYDGTRIIDNLATWLGNRPKNPKKTLWIDEAHITSDDIVIGEGESLTLIHSSLILAGIEGATESWPYSSSFPYWTQFAYFTAEPGQRLRVSISWENGMEFDMMDAGIYSAQDYPNSSTGAPDYPPFYDHAPDLTNYALATGGGSPETTIFQVPEDKGTLFFVAVKNFAGADNSGWVTITDIQCPSIYVESGGTLRVLEESYISVSDAKFCGMGVLLIQDGGMATFEDSSLVDFATLQIEASDVTIRNVLFAGPDYYDLVQIFGASPLIEDSSLWGGRSGIYLESSDSAIIRNNVFAGCNRMGIEAWFSSQCTITNNDISQIISHGIYLRETENCWVENNAIYDIGLAAIYLSASSYCTLTNNAMWSAGGILMNGEHAAHGTHFMAGNSLAGLPILYLRDLEGGEISGSYGQVILANVIGVTVTGLTLTTGGNIQLANSSDCIVASNTIIDTMTIGILLWDTNHCSSSTNDIAGSSPWLGIWMRYSQNGLISDNTIAHFGLNGIRLQSSQNCMISSNTVSDVGDIGIYVLGCSGGSLVSNAVMNSSMGIVLDSSDSIMVSENFLHDSWGSGIAVWSSSLITISANEAYNSYFGAGIELWDAHANVLSCNQLYWNGWTGIGLGESGENWIDNNGIYENGGAGIDIGSCYANVIYQNQISGNSWLGILLADSGSNTIIDNQVYQNGESGITLWSSYENTISRNQVFEHGWAGIEIGDSGSNTVTENCIYQNTVVGINMWSSYGNAISRNQVSEHDWAGISLGESGGNTITKNCIYWNGDGISLGMSYENTITRNQVFGQGWTGISLGESGGNTVMENCIFQNGWIGIWLGDSGSNTITGNCVYQNIDVGISLWNSYENTISSNRICENGPVGIDLVYSGGNAVTDNCIYQNSWAGINLQDSGGNTITGNCIYQNMDTGIHLWSSYGNTISDNQVSGHGWNGITLGQSGGNAITDNDIFQNGADGLNLWNSHENVISDNRIYQNGWLGIRIDDSGGNTITDNRLYQNNDGGLGLGNSCGNVISDNRIYENNWVGIGLGDSYDNTITKNRIYQNSADGLNLWNSGGNWISGNRIYQNAWTGIRLDSSGWNTIIDNRVYQNSDAGLALGDSGTNWISGNRIYENVWAGIGLDHSWRNTIMDNHIYQNGADGLNLWSASGNIISDNHVYQNSASGLYLWNSHGNTIDNNAIADSGADGICIGDSLDNDITGNTIDNSYYNGIVLSNCGIGRDESIIASNVVTNSLSGDGIRLELCSEITVSGNVVSNSWMDGISLLFSANIVVTSNIVTTSTVGDGIWLYESTNNWITSNFAANNGYIGLQLSFSPDNTLTYNVLAYNLYGIALAISDSNTISGSDSYGNIRDGIQLYASHNNIVTENYFTDNSRWGIAVGYSESNWMSDNIVTHSSIYGVYLRDSYNNIITWNTFIQNNLGGISQGYDDGVGNIFEYNYWDDWTGVGSYPIEGSAGNEDPYPRTAP